MNSFFEQNRRAWDERVFRRQWYIDTATDEDFRNPLSVADPFDWFGRDVAGKRVLCLAAGGGRHGPLLAAAGAAVTVVDLSPQMLALDRKSASARGLSLATVEASMDSLPMLASSSFDLVIQPVSSCYVPDILPVYREVARLICPGGIYISQHKQPAGLQAKPLPEPRDNAYLLSEPYYRTGPLPSIPDGFWHRESGTFEFLHRWEEILGGLCRSGFAIEDVTEPRHADPRAEPGSFPHRSFYLAPYVALKARRRNQTAPSPRVKLWIPGEGG